jgi:acetyl-CoA acetyltransferase
VIQSPAAAYRGAAIVGASELPRRKADGMHPFALLQEAVHGALLDAGLSEGDVDGLCVTAGDAGEGGLVEDVIEVAEYLGLRPTFFDSTDIGGCSSMYQTGLAATAVTSGLAEVVVIAYAACPRRFPFALPSAHSWPVGPGAFEMPYGYAAPYNYALFAQRHMHEFGTTPEQLAQIAVQCRSNAALNPHALQRSPIGVGDVLSSAMVASPLHKLDCCVVTDSAGAVVLTTLGRAKDLRRPPVRLIGFGAQVTKAHVSQHPDLVSTPGVVSARRAFEVAGLAPADVDVAQFYDAFTITPLLGLEDSGFCPKGEGGRFIADGHIGHDGSIPINTDGGGLSSNHPGKRGIFAMIEAVRQARGESPGYQVPDVEVSMAHGIGGWFSAAVTLLLSATHVGA